MVDYNRHVTKRLVLLLAILLAPSVWACHTIEQAQELALRNNTFLIVYFSEQSAYEAREHKGRDFFWLEQQDAALLDPYVVFVSHKDISKKYLKKYQIVSLPAILMLDANGKEVYRYTDYGNPTGMKSALANFVLPRYFLINDLHNFHEKQNFRNAIRIAQLYLDYALMVAPEFRANIFRLSQEYLDEACRFAKKKPQATQQQQLQLFALMQLAYAKDFSNLQASIDTLKNDVILPENKATFCFLRYVSAKALQNTQWQDIETEAAQIHDFGDFQKRADRILITQR